MIQLYKSYAKYFTYSFRKINQRIILSDIGINPQNINIETITYEEENEIFLSTNNEIIVLKI